ncbi:MAG: S8 family serine peptidase, partial [Bacteroides sp.]
DHGTHVAGTVAAVNNNGLGVSGVAGGNGSPASGVRLMSCQIFDTYGTARDGAAAFIYSCDNGAVISQNSWSYVWDGSDQTILEADKIGIDYFIKYAGLDENGLQEGPMRGGIVIFAAGNDNISGKSMPAAYEKVFTVSSFAPNLTKSWFSNYGTWCDIAAPGGDNQFGDAGQILSTLPGDGYGFMQGTSMACPHVSGVAALVVSKFGQPGFTADELRERLLRGTNNINPFIPDFAMGIGYINAAKALSDEGEIAPDRVHDLTGGKLTFEEAELIWSITADGDNGKPERYELAWSTTPLWDVDMKNLPSDVEKTLVRVPEDKNIGDKLSVTIRGLEVNQKYYFTVVGIDKNGNQSQSTTLIGTPMENRPPVIEGLPESTITLKRTQQGYLPLKIYDPEGYDWTYSAIEGSGALKVMRTEVDQLILMFDALKAAPGSYKAELLVGDPQGLTQKAVIPYRILENNKPEVAQELGVHTFQNRGETKYYDLNTYFTDADEDVLSYDAVAEDPSIVSVSVEEGILKLESRAYGSTKVTITALD